MKDLKIYYKTDKGKDTIDSGFDGLLEAIVTTCFGLEFSGSGVELETGIRDIHYRKEKPKK